MSAHIDPSNRRGTALLLAIVIAAVAGICVLALGRTSAGAHRSVAMERAITGSESIADSALVRAFHMIDSGRWRGVALPGDTVTLASGASARNAWRVAIGRMGWQTLIVRATSVLPGGAPLLRARSDRRAVIPLIAPLDMPAAAVTGAVPWTIDPGALLDEVPAVGAELRCRPRRPVTPSGVDTLPTAFPSASYPAVDPDTVTGPLVGVFRLARRQVRRPLQVAGLVVSDSDLVVDADLRITGVLVVRRSVVPAGGRLEVVGAVVAGDAGGGRSGLGSGDRVRYDACAIRRAVERVTRPGPSSTWVHLRLF
jgi:hypothetical protein